MLEDILKGFGGDYEKCANNIINEKYKIAKSKFNRSLYKMKSGKYRIMDYNKKSYGEFFDIGMAKKNYVEQYENIYGIIFLSGE